MAVILETSLGDITVDLYTEERPRCCLNFLKLCKIKYYNFCLFHSVQKNLVAQTGDPTDTGKGGQSIFGKVYGEQAAFFEQELKPRIKHKKRGLLSMVNNGTNGHGSQFFITTGENLDYLDNVHTVFGEVSEGQDILSKLNEAITDEEKRPYKDIRVFHTVVLDDPYPDPPGLGEHIPDRSPEPTKERLATSRIGVDEEIDDMDDKTEEEIRKIQTEREAKANAQLLEMVGDLPDAEITPDENVLFVCKLNPVTTSADLEVIFSRFGTIKGCEVIKDKKTEESLQYAFIEFENIESCEEAYFKMDNVIIDDRRVHVDFSQSVAKLQNKKKEDGDKPSFVIKDRSRKDDRYAYVFSDEETGSAAGKKKHKKKKRKHKKARSDSGENTGSSDDEAPRNERKHKLGKERGNTKDKHRSERDRPRERERSRSRDRSRERNKGGKPRDRSRDRQRDRNHDRDRYHREERSDRRDRERDRDRRRDR